MSKQGIYSVVLLAGGPSSTYIDHIRLGDTRAFPVHCTLKARFAAVGAVERIADIAFACLDKFDWREQFSFSGPVYVDGRTKWIEHSDIASNLFKAHLAVLRAISPLVSIGAGESISPDFEGEGYRPHISLDWYFDRRRIMVPDESFQEQVSASISFTEACVLEYVLKGASPSLIERARHRLSVVR